ncbi:MAG: hypothetical protein AAF629_04715 [Chloroflexota bacterium]
MNNYTFYIRLTRFLFPLTITLIVVELGGQAISSGLARVPQATETLAAYGVGWSLVVLFSSPLTHARALGLVLGDSLSSQQKVRQFVVLVALCAMGLLGLLTVPPISGVVIEQWHNISTELGNTVRTCIFWLIPVPLLKGLAAYYTGLLIRHRRTDIVSYANVTSIISGIVVVVLLLPTSFIQEQPIWLPILTTYVNLLTELSIVFIGNWQIQQSTRARRTIDDTVSVADPPLKFAAIIRFFWPLAFVILSQEFSRPLINVYIASRSAGPEALAVLTIVYVLGQFPYRWLNDIRSLATAFQAEANHMYYIVRFAIGCACVSLLMMLILFWTPVRDFILLTLMGLEPALAEQCRIPLMIFAGFSPVVALRAYSQGIVLVEKRTHILALAAPPRLTMVWLTLILLPFVGVSGATLGIAALFAGFVIEALTLWWGVRGYQWFRSRYLPVPTPSSLE